MSSDNDGFDDDKIIRLRDYDRKKPREPSKRGELFNEAAEQALLGAVLVDNEVHRQIEFLRPEHFGRDIHQRIYGAIETLIQRGDTANPTTLEPYFDAELRTLGIGTRYLRDLRWGSREAEIPTADYARLIVELALRRQAFSLLEDALEAVAKADPQRPAEKVVRAFAGELQQVAFRHGGRTAPIDPLDGAEDELLEHAWAVDDWLPLHETIGFSGVGGEGKTTIAQMFATAAALGSTALGLHFRELKAAALLCEDWPDAKETRIRQRNINRALGCTKADLRGKLLLLPRRGLDNYLGVFDRDHNLTLTPAFHELLAQLKAFGARFVVIDGRSDVFFGDQNDERHARAFVRKVTDKIAEELNGLVLMLYHPSRAGTRDNSGQSGSVQWDAAFRCRLILGRPVPKEDAPEDPDARCLIRKKSNFSRSGEALELRWHQGVFVLASDLGSGGVPDDQSKAERVFMAMLQSHQDINLDVSPNSAARNYAPSVFAKDAANNEGCRKPDLEKAMLALLKGGFIRAEGDHRGKRLRRVGAGLFG